MSKSEIIDALRMARSAHIQWRARAQALVAGISVEKEHVPVLYTDCKFGKWYYSSGQRLARLSSFQALEEPHQQLHLVYMKIFKHLFGEDTRSLFSKLLTSKKKHDKTELAAAERLLPQLVGISQTLLEALELLEKDIHALPDKEIAKWGGDQPTEDHSNPVKSTLSRVV